MELTERDAKYDFNIKTQRKTKSKVPNKTKIQTQYHRASQNENKKTNTKWKLSNMREEEVKGAASI
jgi:hypothetical protein